MKTMAKNSSYKTIIEEMFNKITLLLLICSILLIYLFFQIFLVSDLLKFVLILLFFPFSGLLVYFYSNYIKKVHSK